MKKAGIDSLMPATTFSLHPTLEADTLPVGDLGLSRVLLMNDARYPWLILVPRRPDLTELIDLPAAERHGLTDEIALCSAALQRVVRPEKLNVAALGNLVAQLHVHIVGRFASDAAWPNPVWARGAAEPYDAAVGRRRAAEIWAAVGLV